MADLSKRLKPLYAAIRAKAKNAKVVVAGYPKLFHEGFLACPAAGALPQEVREKANAAARTLDNVLAAQAKEKGFIFVDPQASFNGHAVCNEPEWINGISSPTVDSFHPNAAGHEAFGWLIWQQVKGLKN